MFKLSTLIMSLGVTLATAFSASAYDFTLGYAHGDDTDAKALEYSDANAEASAAIYITPEYAKTMAGDILNGATFYVLNRVSAKSATLWVRETLDGPNLAESAEILPSKIKYGKWNSFDFTAPYTIADKGFYIGITWQQQKSCKLVSYIAAPCPDAAWTKAPGKEWNNTDVRGTLCLEGLVSGDKRCALDAQLVNVSFAKYFILKQGFIKSEFTVYNQGTTQIDGFTIEVGIEGLNPLSVNLDNTIPAGGKVTVPAEIIAPITTAIPGNYKVSYAKITKLGNGTDEYLGNNELTDLGSFIVVDHGYKKRVFVEEFTTEKCPNCPAAANLLHQLLELPEYKDCVDAVCHHAGFYTDSFTLSTDNDLLYLFNVPDFGGSFAPAFCIDRIPGPNYDEQTNKSWMAPAFFPSPTSLVTGMLDTQKEETALAFVDIDFDIPGEHDKNLKVTFNAKRSADILGDNGRLTVYLVEDNVKAVSQSGAGTSWKHQHVTRETNSAWGEPIVWDENNEFKYTYEFGIRTSYKLEDLRVVAVINEYNTMNWNGREIIKCLDMPVHNSNYRMVATGYTPDPGESGIHDNLIDKTATIKAIYDLNGVQHNDFVDGINIVVMSDGTTHKIVK